MLLRLATSFVSRPGCRWSGIGDSTPLSHFGKDQERQVERLELETQHRDCRGDLAPVMSGVVEHMEQRARHWQHTRLSCRHRVVKVAGQRGFVETLYVVGPLSGCRDQA